MLAQHVMIELIGNARLVWTAVMELASLMPSDAYTKASVAAGTRAVHDTPRLAEAIRQLAELTFDHHESLDPAEMAELKG